MEQRGRERVSVKFSGEGVLSESGQPFSFEALDFSVNGMRMRVQGVPPAEGQQVALNFEVDTGEAARAPVSLKGEVVRLGEEERGTWCGVRWLENPPAEHLEALEAFYLERFFDALA